MENHKRHNGHFANGFLLGLIVGAAIVFLFATKKGKKLLKVISEEGVENLNDLIEKYSDEDLIDEEEDELEETEKNEMEMERVQAMEVKPTKKRLFRGIRKRSS